MLYSTKQNHLRGVRAEPSFCRMRCRGRTSFTSKLQYPRKSQNLDPDYSVNKDFFGAGWLISRSRCQSELLASNDRAKKTHLLTDAAAPCK